MSHGKCLIYHKLRNQYINIKKKKKTDFFLIRKKNMLNVSWMFKKEKRRYYIRNTEPFYK